MLDLALKGKVALVTGGSDGLGRATVARLASEGALVAACARREEHLRETVNSLKKLTGGEIIPVTMDVTNAEDCQRAVEQTANQYGRLDILINNAGASAAGGFESVTDEQWLADIELKVMGAVRMCRFSIPHLRAAGGGSIVNATIGGAKAPVAKALPTTVTRAAGINLTKSLANEYAADNIRVNTICIGLIKSAQWERRAGEQSMEKFYAEMAERIPLKRVGEAEEYADLVAYLCSASGSYITGTSINLDGGLCAVD